MIDQTISHYKILEKLGEGGMGVVYKAQDLKLDRLVALKFLPHEFTRDAQAKQRFINEAKAASALDHPNICTIYEIGETPQGQLFIAMAYYEGETLSERIKRGPVHMNEIMGIAMQVAEGLQAAHDHGIVHRDIKSSNVMLTAKGQAKIMDFGLARRFDQTMLTRTGSTVGTVPYMSPEQARGETVDHRTDIWSLGVMLYEVIAGQLPFQSAYSEAIIYSILNQDPAPLASLRNDVPARLEHIVIKALRKNLSDRYQAISDLHADLTTLQKEFESGEAIQLAKVRTRKKQLHSFAAIAIFVALLVSAVLYFYPGEVSAIDSLAVMPLENLSGDPEQDYLAAGMHEALITDLARLGGFKRVIARSSVMRYQETDKPLPQIARELGVEALVTGSVLRAGNRVRITAQLIKAESEEHLWADRYERELRDVLALQNEIVAAITQEINLQLSPQEQARLASARPVNPEAYEAYLKGKFYLNKFTPEGFQKGLAYLQQAIEKDPTNPLPYAGLALGYSLIGHEAVPDAFTRAKAAATKALELGETLAETHEAFAEIKLYSDWDFAGAEQDFRRALELNPSLPEAHAHYAWYLQLIGRLDDALPEMRRAQEVDPLAPLWPAWQGWLYWWAGRYEEAIAEARKSVELNPDFPWGLYVLGGVYAQKGMYEEAIAAHQKAAAASRAVRWGLGHTYALAGRRDEARKVAAELEKEPTPMNAWGLAEIYTALGEKDEAFRWLETGFKLRFSWMPWIERNPAFEPLRDDATFQEMVHRLELPS